MKRELITLITMFSMGQGCAPAEESATETPKPWESCEALGTGPEGFPTTAKQGVNVGETAKDFTACLTDSQGADHHLYQYLGNVVLVNLGAGWCPPCQDEADDIQALYETYQNQGFQVVMGMGEAWRSGTKPTAVFLKDWADTYGITFPMLSDPNWTLAQYYRPTEEGYIPLNLIVDRDGVVVYNSVGGIQLMSAKRVISEALAKQATLMY